MIEIEPAGRRIEARQPAFHAPAQPWQDLPAQGMPRNVVGVVFEHRRHDVEDAPADWRRWYRLAVAYDVAGDRRRARAAMRTAIARELA